MDFQNEIEKLFQFDMFTGHGSTETKVFLFVTIYLSLLNFLKFNCLKYVLDCFRVKSKNLGNVFIKFCVFSEFSFGNNAI